MFRRRNAIQADKLVDENYLAVSNEAARDGNILSKDAAEFIARLEYAAEMLMHGNSVTPSENKMGKIVVPANSPAIVFSLPPDNMMSEIELQSDSTFVPYEMTKEEIEELEKSRTSINKGHCNR